MGSDDAGTAGSKCAGCAASRSADTSSHSTAAVRLNSSPVEATGLRCEPCGLALDTFVVSIVTWVPWNCVRVDAQLALTDSVPRSRRRQRCAGAPSDGRLGLCPSVAGEATDVRCAITGSARTIHEHDSPVFLFDIDPMRNTAP